MLSFVKVKGSPEDVLAIYTDVRLTHAYKIALGDFWKHSDMNNADYN